MSDNSVSNPRVADTPAAHEQLEPWLHLLLPRHRKVLILRAGLRGQARQSLRQIGGLLGISKERVRQLEKRALEIVRTRGARPKRADNGAPSADKPVIPQS